MRSFDEYIKESYSFRLGGSQQKGFEQNKVKTFAELTERDVIFYWSKNYLDKTKIIEYPILRIEKSKDEIDFYYDKKYENFCIDVSADDFNNTIYFTEYGTCCATSYEELAKGVEDKFDVRINGSEKYEGVVKGVLKYAANNESYSFRLGGSQQKGFNQNVVKTFNELKAGDTIYEAVIRQSRIFLYVGVVSEFDRSYKNEFVIGYNDKKIGFTTVHIENECGKDFVYFNKDMNHIWSTDKDKMIEFVEKEYGKEIAENLIAKFDEVV